MQVCGPPPVCLKSRRNVGRTLSLPTRRLLYLAGTSLPSCLVGRLRCTVSRLRASGLRSQLPSTGSESVSVLTFTPAAADDGSLLECRAENPLFADSEIRDQWRLAVHCEYFSSAQLNAIVISV